MIDVLFIVVASSICSCNKWLDMEDWAMQNEEWLHQYLELSNGIPSWYMIERVFDVIDPKQFEKCFAGWVRQITKTKKADYVLLLKGNHALLHEEVEAYFKDAEQNNFTGVEYHRTLDKGYGRIEERKYYYSTDIK